MKNLKGFLGLAFMLTLFVWSTVKVLAVDETTTSLERLKNAVSLLAKDDSLIQDTGDFGYYAPAWERGQVLGVAITACPNNQAWFCAGGVNPVIGNDGTMTCADGGIPSCQNPPNQPPQNNFPPCSDGQVYLCSGVNPIWTNGQMTCANGGQPACGVMANQPVNQPFPTTTNTGTFFCYSLNRQATGVECDAADKAKSLNLPSNNNQPGSSQPYQNYQPQGSGQGGQMMGPNQGNNSQPGFNQSGPSEEDMAKQQAQRDAQQLKMMQKDVARVMQGLKQPKALMAKATKAGLTIPQGLTMAISGIENYVKTVKNAKSMSEVESLDSNPGDYFSEISDYMGLLSRQLEFPKMLKQAKQNFKTYQTAYTRLAKNKNINTVDLKKVIDDTASALAQIEANAKTATDTDSFDAVMSALGDIYDINFDNIRTEQQQAEFFANYKKGLTGFTTMIKSFTSAIKRAEQKKLDADSIATAKEQLAQVQQMFNDVKTAANNKPIDTEDLMSKVSDLSDLVNELNNALGDLGVGVNNMVMPQIPQQPQNNFQMPSSFNYNQQPQISGSPMGLNNSSGSTQGGFGQNPQTQMAPGTY